MFYLYLENTVQESDSAEIAAARARELMNSGKRIGLGADGNSAAAQIANLKDLLAELEKEFAG